MLKTLTRFMFYFHSIRMSKQPLLHVWPKYPMGLSHRPDKQKASSGKKQGKYKGDVQHSDHLLFSLLPDDGAQWADSHPHDCNCVSLDWVPISKKNGLCVHVTGCCSCQAFCHEDISLQIYSLFQYKTTHRLTLTESRAVLVLSQHETWACYYWF